MREALTNAVLSHVGPFYHVTSNPYARDILRDGLVPEKWNAAMYTDVGFGGPFVCVTIASFVDDYVNAIGWKYEDEEIVLLRIETEGLFTADVSLDTSHSAFAERIGSEDPLALIRKGAPLACYSTIAPAYISELKRFSPKMGREETSW